MFIVGVGPVHEVERLRVGDRGCNRICDFCQFITAIGVIGEPLAPFYGLIARPPLHGADIAIVLWRDWCHFIHCRVISQRLVELRPVYPCQPAAYIVVIGIGFRHRGTAECVIQVESPKKDRGKNQAMVYYFDVGKCTNCSRKQGYYKEGAKNAELKKVRQIQ